MKYNRLILTAILILTALILVFAACSKKSLNGNLLAPQPPSLFWAQVPIDSLNHHNPVLHWFSTDHDGVVLDYYYTVLHTSTVDSLRGTGTVEELMANFPTDIPWVLIHTDSATIPLYSVSDTSEDGTPVYVDQYIFIKAMDDDSLYSNTIFRHLARNNHPPTCYVIVPTAADGVSPEPQWCLSDTNSSWKGIRIAWVGKDSVDIPGSIQPDFEWNVKIYGPFLTLDDCAPIPESLYIEFRDPLDTTNVWIKDKQKFLTNLETGCYLLSVRNRDDAFTPSIPAEAKLVIYEPTWRRHPELTKPILIANHSFYYNGTDPNNGRSQGELLIGRRDSVRAFYMQMLQGAGFDTATEVDWKDYQVLNNARPVPKADLYNHRMVIIVDTDYSKPLDYTIQEPEYALYMNVDGMVWIIGRCSFNDPALVGGMIDLMWAGRNGDKSGHHTIASKFFNLASVFSQQRLDLHQAEFRGAASINAAFPDLAIDTLKVAQTSWAQPISHTTDTTFYNYSHGLLGVDYLGRLSSSETIYKFESIYPDTSKFEGFPVAIRYDNGNGTFKTSYFCFPLYFIQRDQAQVVVQQMLDWFNPRSYLDTP